MSTILDTVVSYEDQLVDLVKKAQAPVVEYVAKGVELAALPRSKPTIVTVSCDSRLTFTHSGVR